MSKEVTRRKFLKQSGAGSFVALTASSKFSALSVSRIWEEVEKAGGVGSATSYA